MDATASVSVVIPAYNEAERIVPTLEKIGRYADATGRIREIIVVDDGSRDLTAAVVRVFAAQHPRVRLVSYHPNAGKGYAIRQGVQAAKGDMILISDADLSTPIEELETLLKAHAQSDIVIGSRAVDESTVRRAQGKLRRTMGKTFNRIMRAITGLPFRDTQCGFKLLPSSARKIFWDATVDRFAYDVEFLILAGREGFSIAEVPVLWFNSPDSRVHVLRDSFRMLRDVVAIRRRLGRFAGRVSAVAVTPRAAASD